MAYHCLNTWNYRDPSLQGTNRNNFEASVEPVIQVVVNKRQCSCGETFLKDSGNHSLCPTCRNPRKRITRAEKMLSKHIV